MIISKAEAQALCDMAGRDYRMGLMFHRTRIVATDGVAFLALDREVMGPAEPVVYDPECVRRVLRIWSAQRDALIDFDADELRIQAKWYEARVPLRRRGRNVLGSVVDIVKAHSCESVNMYASPIRLARMWGAVARLIGGRADGANIVSGRGSLSGEPIVGYGEYFGFCIIH